MTEAPRKVKWRVPRDHVLTPFIMDAIAESRNDVVMWLLEKAGSEPTEAGPVVLEEDDEEGRQRGRLVLPEPDSPS